MQKVIVLGVRSGSPEIWQGLRYRIYTLLRNALSQVASIFYTDHMIASQNCQKSFRSRKTYTLLTKYGGAWVELLINGQKVFISRKEDVDQLTLPYGRSRMNTSITRKLITM